MLGKNLERIMDKETLCAEDLVTMPTSEAKRRQLRIDDDLEDFLDEGAVNPTGKGCPMALRLLACMLLMEITAFMRETFKTLPRTRGPIRVSAGAFTFRNIPIVHRPIFSFPSQNVHTQPPTRKYGQVRIAVKALRHLVEKRFLNSARFYSHILCTALTNLTAPN